MESDQKAVDPLALAFEHAPAEAMIVDAETQSVVRANAAMRKALGYSPIRLRSMTLAELLPEACTYVTMIGRRTEDTDIPLEFLGKLCRADGSFLDVRLGVRIAESAQRRILIQVVNAFGATVGYEEESRALLQAAIEALPDGFAIFDEGDRLKICNSRFVHSHAISAPVIAPGVSFEGLLRYGVAHGQYPAAVGREREWMNDRLVAHRAAEGLLLQEFPDGRWLRVAERQLDNGGTVVLCTDVTDERMEIASARNAEALMREAIDAMPAGVQLFDDNDRLVIANQYYRDLYAVIDEVLKPGVSYEEIIRHGVKMGQFPEAIGREEKFVRRALAARRGGFHELVYQLDNGQWMRSSNIHLEDGSKVGFRVDVTDLKQKQFELERMAETDPLTGLLNRRGIRRHLAVTAPALKDMERLVAFHIDLDKFKAVNDGIGHDAGDFVLTDIARRLRGSIREGDVLARVGGDEFLALMVTREGDAGLIGISDALRREAAAPMRFRGRVCQVGATIGIAAWAPGDPHGVDQVMSNADIALNIGKQDGRNRSILYDGNMREAEVEKALLAQELRQSLCEGRFLPYLQPQFAADGQRITGFECLARWNHPDRGILPASSFLGVAEEAGLVAQIDSIVMRQGLCALRQLRSEGYSDVTLSLNLSGGRLSDAGIVDEIAFEAEGRNLQPSDLRIEVVEAALIGERSLQIVENVQAFAARGFAVELDNFGTGQTAVASLRDFPVDRIKIDRSLVHGIDVDPHSRVIAETILTLALRLELPVLAEGVETEGELLTLQGLGCSALQGHHLARPMPAEKLMEWLKERGDPGTARSSA